MNLPRPPRTGNVDLDGWLEWLHKYLQFPVFHGLRMLPRATPGDTAEGHVYYDSDDDKLKVKTTAGWEDTN